MKKLLTILSVFVCLIIHATDYFVKTGGSDAANGLSDGTAWATIVKVNGLTFSAGDRIQFKAGNTFVGRLNIPSSGSAGNPIIFTRYSTGSNPIIDGNNAQSRCISTGGKNYITLDGVDLRNSTGDGTWGTGNHIIIQNSTINNCGNYAISQTGGFTTVTNCTITTISQIGVELAGGNNIVTYNNISNTNTSASGGGGAVHINAALNADNNSEIAYNTIDNIGSGGNQSFIHSIYVDVGTTNVNVHHNTITNSVGGLGIHMKGSGSVHNNYIEDAVTGGIGVGHNGANNVIQNIYSNVITNTLWGIYEDAQGAGDLQLNIYNNTFYLNNNTTSSAFSEEIKIQDNVKTLTIKNNIIYGAATRSTYSFEVAQTNAVINNNILYNSSTLIKYNGTFPSFATWQGLGFDTNGLNANPLFVANGANFHLQSGSPAINAGINLGLPYVGSAPDIGAFEFIPPSSCDSLYNIVKTIQSDIISLKTLQTATTNQITVLQNAITALQVKVAGLKAVSTTTTVIK